MAFSPFEHTIYLYASTKVYMYMHIHAIILNEFGYRCYAKGSADRAKSGTGGGGM